MKALLYFRILMFMYRILYEFATNWHVTLLIRAYSYTAWMIISRYIVIIVVARCTPSLLEGAAGALGTASNRCDFKFSV